MDEYEKYAVPSSGRGPSTEADEYEKYAVQPDRSAASADSQGGGMLDKLKRFINFDNGRPKPITPSIGDAFGFANDMTTTAGVEAAKMLGGKSPADAGDTVWKALRDAKQRKSLPVQLLQSGWSPEMAGIVGVPLQMAADPFGAFMSMRNPAPTGYNVRPQAGQFGPAPARMVLEPETKLGIGNTNTVPGRLAETPIASPIRGVTAELGQDAERKMYENAFRKVNTAFGQRKGKLKDVPYMTDKLLDDRIFKPGMSAGEMQQAFSDHMKGLLGDEFNDIWSKYPELRQNPEAVFQTPEFIQWAEGSGTGTALRKSKVKQLKEMVGTEIEHANNHVFSDPGEVAEAHKNGLISQDQFDQYIADLVESKGKSQRLVIPKENPGANPDELTKLAVDSSNVATGKAFPPKSDIMKENSIDDVLKQGQMAVGQGYRRLRNEAVAGQSPATAARLDKANKDFHIYRTGKDPMNALLDTEKNRMAVPMLRSAMALLGHPFAATTLGIAKWAQHPVGAVGAGDLVRRLGESNIWDRIQQQLTQDRPQDPAEKREPLKINVFGDK